MGEGQYGYVYKAIVVHDNARWPVALKRIKKEGCSPEEVRKQQEDLLTEGNIMASIDYHDNIANLQVGECIGILHETLGGVTGFQLGTEENLLYNQQTNYFALFSDSDSCQQQVSPSLF